MSSFILLTGMPGCGKTTMVKKVVDELKKKQIVKCIQGFYTEECRNTQNERIGFDVVSLDGKRGALARVK
jgi:nucleoside-triphosphatase